MADDDRLRCYATGFTLAHRLDVAIDLILHPGVGTEGREIYTRLVKVNARKVQEAIERAAACGIRGGAEASEIGRRAEEFSPDSSRRSGLLDALVDLRGQWEEENAALMRGTVTR